MLHMYIYICINHKNETLCTYVHETLLYYAYIHIHMHIMHKITFLRYTYIYIHIDINTKYTSLEFSGCGFFPPSLPPFPLNPVPSLLPLLPSVIPSLLSSFHTQVFACFPPFFLPSFVLPQPHASPLRNESMKGTK